jgi:indole-3-glycerol phosphate synthase
MDRQHFLAASRTEAQRLAGQRLSEVTPSRRDFGQFVATQRQELAFIARFTRGGRDPEQLADAASRWDDVEVAALAVATHAGGLSLSDLAAVSAAVTAPVLRDDLLLAPGQVYDARLHGADAVVFPAADLDAAALGELVSVASSLHMTSVVEVLSRADLESALALPHAIVGLRCVDTDGRVDPPQVAQIASDVPRQRTVLCLAPVSSSAECVRLRRACDAVCIDEASVGSEDIAATLQHLLEG